MEAAIHVNAPNQLLKDRGPTRTVTVSGLCQHSAHIGPGRDGLFDLIRSVPDTLRYEHGLILVEGDYVIVHGRFSGNGRRSQDREI